MSQELKVGKSRISVGRFTYGFTKQSVLQWREGAGLKIGSFCSIAQGLTVILGGNHRVDWATTFPFGHIFTDELGGGEIVGHPTSKGDVTIGHDVWIGRDVMIMPGLEIGHGAVIAAGSVVTKSVGNYEIWGGNPAKKLKDRFDAEVTTALLDLAWWDLEVDVIRRIAPMLSQSPTLSTIEAIKAIVEGKSTADEPD